MKYRAYSICQVSPARSCRPYLLLIKIIGLKRCPEVSQGSELTELNQKVGNTSHSGTSHLHEKGGADVSLSEQEIASL